MTQLISLRDQLRNATGEDHQRVDHALSTLQLAHLADYALFLRIHRRALAQLARCCREADREDFNSMFDCVEKDLASCNQGKIERVTPGTLLPQTPGHQLGTSYVLRGSRLGAAVLRRRVSPEASKTYLDYLPAISWAELLNQVEEFSRLHPPPVLGEAIKGAKDAFRIFSAAVEETLGTRLSVP